MKEINKKFFYNELKTYGCVCDGDTSLLTGERLFDCAKDWHIRKWEDNGTHYKLYGHYDYESSPFWSVETDVQGEYGVFYIYKKSYYFWADEHIEEVPYEDAYKLWVEEYELNIDE